MAVEKVSKLAQMLYQYLPAEIVGVGLAVAHKTNVKESVMNIDKDIETILVACVSAVAVFLVRKGMASLSDKYKAWRGSKKK